MWDRFNIISGNLPNLLSFGGRPTGFFTISVALGVITGRPTGFFAFSTSLGIAGGAQVVSGGLALSSSRNIGAIRACQRARRSSKVNSLCARFLREETSPSTVQLRLLTNHFSAAARSCFVDAKQKPAGAVGIPTRQRSLPCSAVCQSRRHSVTVSPSQYSIYPSIFFKFFFGKIEVLSETERGRCE